MVHIICYLDTLTLLVNFLMDLFCKVGRFKVRKWKDGAYKMWL